MLITLAGKRKRKKEGKEAKKRTKGKKEGGIYTCDVVVFNILLYDIDSYF